MRKNTPLLLAILDGWGIAEKSPTNAVDIADTPNMDEWSSAFPSTTLVAHNGLVGLPEGQMGNSEVGHLNIGAGRIVYQDFTRINLAIESGDFAENQELNGVMDKVQAKGSALHLMGLLSDGGVHSHVNHLVALLLMCKKKGLEKVFVHCFMDGRDTPPSSGLEYMRHLASEMKQIGCGRIATVSGRYWAMDRDKRWDRVEKAWQAVVAGHGNNALDPVEAIQEAYGRQETDEFIVPTVLVDAGGEAVGPVSDGDGVVFFNFRADRVRELCHAFIDTDFKGFEVTNRPNLLELVTMTEYESDFPFPVAFAPMSMNRILGEELSRHGLRQLRIAETEKYAHVTYFFNGGEEEPFDGEERLLIESPRDVATYDLKPAMSADAVNFANCDMVGHTGIFDAAVKACATVDRCLGRIRSFMRERNGVMLITADHGNAEIMVDPATSGAYTAHSLNPVPLVLVADQFKECTLEGGGALKDIAPTMLSILDLPVPAEMEGENLLNC